MDFRSHIHRGLLALTLVFFCMMGRVNAEGAKAAVGSGDVADVFGTIQHPLKVEGKAGSVLIFYWHDCPICNSYVPEINRLRRRFPRFVFYMVEVDPDLTADQGRAHAEQFKLETPLLLDPGHRLVGLAKATVTPEAVVFGTNDMVLYRGRIDNTYEELGVRRAAATTHDLSDALDAILAGKPVAAQQAAVGCWIPH